MAFGNIMNGFQQPYPQPDPWQQNRQPVNMPLPSTNQNRSFQIPCRSISNPDEIMPNEVPMDGRIALFMARDNSRIIAKQWNPNGLIDTVEYVPNLPTEPKVDSAPFDQQILERLDRLDRMLTSLMSPIEPAQNGGVSE